MGISRTPVREALRELTTEKFIKLNPNQGKIVTSVSIENVQNVLQIRAILEGLADRLATTMISKKEIKKQIAILSKWKNLLSIVIHLLLATQTLDFTN